MSLVIRISCTAGKTFGHALYDVDDATAEIAFYPHDLDGRNAYTRSDCLRSQRVAPAGSVAASAREGVGVEAASWRP